MSESCKVCDMVACLRIQLAAANEALEKASTELDRLSCLDAPTLKRMLDVTVEELAAEKQAREKAEAVVESVPAALKEYRCQFMQYDDGDGGMALVDVFSMGSTSKTIKPGIAELELLADFIQSYSIEAAANCQPRRTPAEIFSTPAEKDFAIRDLTAQLASEREARETAEAALPGLAKPREEAGEEAEMPIEQVRQEIAAAGITVSSNAAGKLLKKIADLSTVYHCAQAVLTAWNIGPLPQESLLHKKLREVLINYRRPKEEADNG